MNNAVQIIETEQRLTWRDRLNDMKISEKMICGFGSANAVRRAIWLLEKTTALRFTTKTEGLTVVVTRLEDETVINQLS